MAKVLHPSTMQQIAKRSPRSIYDFAKWSDGQVWQLVRGIDFHCTTNTFSGYLYRYAEKIGMKVFTSANRTSSGRNSTITFQFTERDGRHPYPANVMEEFDEDECRVDTVDAAGQPSRCIVWDALRERIGLNDSSSGTRGFKREFLTAENTLI